VSVKAITEIPVGPALDLWAAAAVRQTWDPSELLNSWLERNSGASREQRREATLATLDLQAVGDTATEAEGATQFSLPGSRRIPVLRQIGRARALQELESINVSDTTLQQEVLANQLQHRHLVLGSATSRAQLAALQAIAPLAEALGTPVEIPIDQLDAELRRADFLSTLGGADLHRIVERPALLRVLHSAWSSKGTRAPVLVEGPGGIGKSTLVTHFIDRLLRQDETTIIFHLDFDRPVLQRARAQSVIGDLVRQALKWWSTGEQKDLLELSYELGDSSLALESSDKVTRSAESIRDLHDVASRLLSSLGGPGKDIVLFADSFEQVETFDSVASSTPHDVAQMLVEAGARVLVIYASRSFSRAGSLSSRRVLRISQFNCKEATRYLGAEARRLGLRLQKGIRQTVFAAIGRSPLALRLAVGLLEKEGPNADISAWGDLARKSHERIQAELYDRYLLRIRDSEVRKLARPGLLLRRISERTIASVLAIPCNLNLRTRSIRELFEAARREVQLFSNDPTDSSVIWHRPDVRAVMLRNLDDSIDAETARGINEAAVLYYEGEGKKIPGSRIEALYHRLRLGQSDELLHEHWSHEAGTRLKSSLDEFPEAARAFARDRLGAASKEYSESRVAGPGNWIDFYTRASNEITRIEGTRLDGTQYSVVELRKAALGMLQSGDNDRLATTLSDVGLDSITSELGDIYIQLLISQRRYPEVLAAGTDLIASDSPRQSLSVRARALGSVASFHEGRTAFSTARKFWLHAARLAKIAPNTLTPTTEDWRAEAAGIRVGELRISRKLESEAGTRSASLIRLLDEVQLLSAIVRTRVVFARELAAELGDVLDLVGADAQLRTWIELVRFVVEVGEAFPSALRNKNRVSEIGFALFEKRFDTMRELTGTILRHTYNGDEVFVRLVPVLRFEVDWTLRNFAQSDDHLHLSGPA